jgi:hypothetical protein
VHRLRCVRSSQHARLSFSSARIPAGPLCAGADTVRADPTQGEWDTVGRLLITVMFKQLRTLSRVS